MENGLHMLFLWMHILGVALWVGPQFFLAFAWVPASRRIIDDAQRIAALRIITERFLWIGGMGLLLILIAGSFLIATWRDYYAYPDEAGFMEVRYGLVFTIKMAVLAVMLVASGLHIFLVGPRQLDLLEAQAAGKDVSEAELSSVRKWSMTLSITGLALTLVIMVMGVSLTTANFSLQDL